MIIRKYIVDDINEALFRIKHELGSDAYIISQKMIRQPGVKGFFSNKKLEVTVGLVEKEGAVENFQKQLVSANKDSQLINSTEDSVKKFQNAEKVVNTYQNNEKPSNTYSQNNKTMSYYNRLFEEKQKSLLDEGRFNKTDSYSLDNKDTLFNMESGRPNRNLQDMVNLNEERESKFKVNDILNSRDMLINNNNNSSDDISKATSNLFKENNTTVGLNKDVNFNINDDIKKELKEIKSIVKEIISDNESTNYLNELLFDLDICKELCDEIRENCTLTQEEMKNEKIVKKYLKDKFYDILKICEADFTDKFIVMGPTGSGKTSTVCKLAGMIALNSDKKVGLVSLDTSASKSLDDLKSYANILKVPYKLVNNLNDIREVFKEMKNCHMILIDTVGKGNKNIIQINELNMLVQSIETDGVSLVVSAGSKQKDIDLFLESFKGIKFKNIIVTKLDETNSYGCFVNICYKTSLPISFVTNGQEIPIDIKKINKKEILNMMFKE